MPNRADYKTRKEYRFAKKIEKGELSKDPLKAAVMMSGKKMEARSERLATSRAAMDEKTAQRRAARREKSVAVAAVRQQKRAETRDKLAAIKADREPLRDSFVKGLTFGLKR